MQIRYFFDVISPYSALSWKVLRRYQPIWDLKIEAVPVFLGGIMKTTGNRPPAMLPNRALFQSVDLQRNKSFYDVPLLDTPSNFFSEVARDIIQCQRLLIAAEQDGSNVFQLIDALTDSIHLDPTFRNESNDLKIDRSFLLAACSKAGITEQKAIALLEACASPEVKKQLGANTEEACEAGAYGSPTIMVHVPGQTEKPQLFFGSDRFEQMAFLFDKPWHGPVPGRSSSKL